MKKKILGIMGKLSISVAEEDGLSLIELEGEIDVFTSQELKKLIDAYIDKDITNIILDMEHVDYLDSSTISVLIATMERLKPGGGKLMLVKLNDTAKKIFKMANLLDIFDIYSDVEEAKKSLTQ